MSLKSELARAAAAITAALALGALAVGGAGLMRSQDQRSLLPPQGSGDLGLPHTPAGQPADPGRETDPAQRAPSSPAPGFETVLETQLSWGTPILNVFALCHGRTQIQTGDSEFRHFRIEGVDWLEYYESAGLPGGEIAIRGFRAPMASLTAATEEGVLVITASEAQFIGGAWHLTAAGEINDAIELEPAPGLAIPACLDAEAAATELNTVFAGDHSEVRGRPRS